MHRRPEIVRPGKQAASPATDSNQLIRSTDISNHKSKPSPLVVNISSYEVSETHHPGFDPDDDVVVQEQDRSQESSGRNQQRPGTLTLITNYRTRGKASVVVTPITATGTMSTYAAYPATSQYYEYSQPSYAAAYTQPSYTLEAHPYADAYTTNSSHLAPDYREPRTSSSRRTSISPSSSGEYSHASSGGSGHHRRRSSQIYLDEPARIVHASGSPSRRDRERAERAEREEREEREAKEERRRRRREEKASTSSSKAMPIPLPRSSTMPTGHSITPAHETRGRRPVIMSEYVDGGETSARMPIGPVDVLEHASSRRNSTTKRYSSTGRYEDHHRRRSSGGSGSGSSSGHRRHDSNGGSPHGYASGEEEANRRRAHRRSNRAEVRQGPGFATSAPDFGAAYGKSPSAYASSYASTAGSAHLSSSPAADEATKTLRWADQERRAQNDRISSRPKLARVDSVKANANAKTQGEVKGILKNSPNSSRPQSSSGPRSRGNSVNVDDLAAGVERLSTSERGDEEHRRLKDRFNMPTRRHSTFGPGAGSRDRTEYWADGGREKRYYY
ncbi:hypothetical protein PpBr36_02232 [Pyricularia pennisetigena]|uniref:hypothetical protein n=1 Tax=Pyricularia pennisetigena TaxID=1578925 RepID=UPI00114F7EEC|nr:hypothetical protein PpBr36_02232 [Pyricularia pennisetigena]TLS29927.1 hypothetical protein PpBr36_02232 [Pyricularia pennisetigena]